MTYLKAVQGDFSPNNILLNDNSAFESLIDFNIAGDEVFINHLVGEGIFSLRTYGR